MPRKKRDNSEDHMLIKNVQDYIINNRVDIQTALSFLKIDRSEFYSILDYPTNKLLKNQFYINIKPKQEIETVILLAENTLVKFLNGYKSKEIKNTYKYDKDGKKILESTTETIKDEIVSEDLLKFVLTKLFLEYKETNINDTVKSLMMFNEYLREQSPKLAQSLITYQKSFIDEKNNK